MTEENKTCPICGAIMGVTRGIPSNYKCVKCGCEIPRNNATVKTKRVCPICKSDDIYYTGRSYYDYGELKEHNQFACNKCHSTFDEDKIVLQPIVEEEAETETEMFLKDFISKFNVSTEVEVVDEKSSYFGTVSTLLNSNLYMLNKEVESCELIYNLPDDESPEIPGAYLKINLK